MYLLSHSDIGRSSLCLVSRGNKPAIDPDTHRSITKLIQSVPSMSGRDSSSSFTKLFDDLLRADSPPIELPEPEVLPVFSRAQRPGRSVELSAQEGITLATSLASTANLPWLTPVAMKKEDEDDIANENLVLVDGWRESIILALMIPSSRQRRRIQDPFVTVDTWDTIAGQHLQ